MLAILNLDLRTARVLVSTDLQDGLPLLRADRVQLQQVVLNLVTNAIEAMRPITDRPHRLRLTSGSIENSEIRIVIEDTGIGIECQDKDRIFELFFTTKSAGMGIGLTICQSIIVSHGGSLRVSANEPHGTVFEIVLPAVAEDGD